MIAEILNGDLIPVRREALRILFDAVTNSLDFGSGYLDSEDVEALREIAVILGVDPWVATPSEHRRNYPHLFKTGYRTWCNECQMTADHPAHPG